MWLLPFKLSCVTLWHMSISPGDETAGISGGLGGPSQVRYLHHIRRTKVPGYPTTSRQIQKGEHGV